MQHRKLNTKGLGHWAALSLCGVLAETLFALPAHAQDGGSILSGLQGWLASNLPWAVTSLLSLIVAWGFGYLMFLLLFSGMRQHGPVAARIGIWFATCVMLLLLALLVLPVYFGINFVLWHWVLALTLLLISFFISYATAPKSPKVGT